MFKKKAFLTSSYHDNDKDGQQNRHIRDTDKNGHNFS